LPAGESCRQAFGLELSPDSCDAARKALAEAGLSARIQSGGLDPQRLARHLPPPDGIPEIHLLDPPRQGTAPGLIRALAERKPRRVAHLFCDMDTMPAEVERWRKQGYMVAKVQPYDMFPGTDNLEVLVVFMPDRFGLLNRKPTAISGQPSAKIRRT
jgi:tRNA/tmRNA/rRNA uracil-C5-methylase (TrmA/RlmC/RlmD family)